MTDWRNPATNDAFLKWRDTFPEQHWSKNDLSACRLGFDAGYAFASQKEVERYKEMYVQKANEKVAEFRRAEAAESRNAEMVKALNDLLDHVDRNTCLHEGVHRGGSIWTICDDCGKKWADDRGGFVPYSDPDPVARARAALKGQSYEA